jgi:hypothetical protein
MFSLYLFPLLFELMWNYSHWHAQGSQLRSLRQPSSPWWTGNRSFPCSLASVMILFPRPISTSSRRKEMVNHGALSPPTQKSHTAYPALLMTKPTLQLIFPLAKFPTVAGPGIPFSSQGFDSNLMFWNLPRYFRVSAFFGLPPHALSYLSDSLNTPILAMAMLSDFGSLIRIYPLTYTNTTLIFTLEFLANLYIVR